MAVGEPNGPWIRGDLGEAKGPVLGHHRAEEAKALRFAADLLHLLRTESIGDEPGDPAILDDAEGDVPGSDQAPGSLDRFDE